MAFVRLSLFAALLVTGALSAPGRQQLQPASGSQRDFDGRTNVTFYLYTQDNPETPQILTIDDDTSAPLFNPSNPTRIVFHGRNSQPLDEFREAYIATGDEYNIVLVDWSGPAYGDKPVVANGSIWTGNYVSQALNHWIEYRGLNPDDLHLIGHSIGAHVAGISGRGIGGKASEIVALDPADDAYDSMEYAGLEKTDAQFVQVVHTTATRPEMLEILGNVDFFPNGGTQQAGCVEQLCNHMRAIVYFVESITSNTFIATQCTSYEEYKQGACSANTHVAMGEYAPLTLSGAYYLDTNEQSPFAQGQTDL